eukprot:scaffold4501_cov395-Prasinococcus_capsulatus_cf.AAC.12
MAGGGRSGERGVHRHAHPTLRLSWRRQPLGLPAAAAPGGCVPAPSDVPPAARPSAACSHLAP